jgi:hypothetical protein
LPIRECAYNAGASPDLAQDALERIVGANQTPVLFREAVVGERLLGRRFKAQRPGKPRNFSITRKPVPGLGLAVEAF